MQYIEYVHTHMYVYVNMYDVDMLVLDSHGKLPGNLPGNSPPTHGPKHDDKNRRSEF